MSEIQLSEQTAIRSAVPMKPGQKHVLILGGGFAGLAAAKVLAGHDEVFVTLLDQRNYHLFQPLLYQVATAGLNPSDIAVPIRSEFRDAENVMVRLRRVVGIDLAGKNVRVEGIPPVPYDYLILACGAQHSYFGKNEWESFAPGLKTLAQATEIRRRILVAFERAENERDPEVQRALLNFVVVGGGPTGVELAGAIADIARTVLVRDFRRINPSTARVVLLEGGPRILPVFDPRLSEHAKRDLEALGVEVRLGALVTSVDLQGVQIGGSERIQARTVIWAAGVEAQRMTRDMGVQVDRAGRVYVGEDLSIPGHPSAFAVGDIAHAEVDGKLTPGLAPAAQQMGRLAARNILASVRGGARQKFVYKDKGIMATIGKHRAVAQLGRMRHTGYLAWVEWLLVHVFTLIGFRNRLAVFFDWTLNYLFSKRGARLITERDYHSVQENGPREGRLSPSALPPGEASLAPAQNGFTADDEEKEKVQAPPSLQ